MTESREDHPMRSLSAAILAAGVIVLGILGLANLVPRVLASIATMAMGAALCFEGRALAHRAAPGRPGDPTFFRWTTDTETVTGTVALVLGILSLLSLDRMILLPIAAIIVGVGILFESGALRGLVEPMGAASASGGPRPARIVKASAGIDGLAGLTGVVLGILALVIPGYASALVLISMLVYGVTMTVNGAVLSREGPLHTHPSHT